MIRVVKRVERSIKGVDLRGVIGCVEGTCLRVEREQERGRGRKEGNETSGCPFPFRLVLPSKMKGGACESWMTRSRLF